jgi:hypothetical protein
VRFISADGKGDISEAPNLEVQLNNRGFGVSRRLHWGGVALALMTALVLGAATGVIGRHHLNETRAAQPLSGVTAVEPQPLPTVSQTVSAPPAAPPPDHILLQVPFTTQAPLNNWAQHQESCEAATLSMLISYWRHDPSVVIDPRTADGMIDAIDSWKPQPDLTDRMMGELASQHWGYGYQIVPNDPKVIAAQLAAGRPLIAEVRTHGLGNPRYPGYSNHFEQQGWSVPHFILIIGYDSTGVFLNDPGISGGAATTSPTRSWRTPSTIWISTILRWRRVRCCS